MKIHILSIIVVFFFLVGFFCCIDIIVDVIKYNSKVEKIKRNAMNNYVRLDIDIKSTNGQAFFVYYDDKIDETHYKAYEWKNGTFKQLYQLIVDKDKIPIDVNSFKKD